MIKGPFTVLNAESHKLYFKQYISWLVNDLKSEKISKINLSTDLLSVESAMKWNNLSETTTV